MRMHIGAMLLGGALTCLPIGARAQGAAVTGAWTRLEDSVAAAPLPRRRDDLATPGKGAEAAAWVRYGLLTLRRYHATHKPDDYDDALHALEQAASRATGDAWVQYALGRTLLESPELRPQPGQLIVRSVFRRASGTDPRSRSVASLREALRLDPHLEAAALLQAEQALDSRTPEELHTAADALQTIAQGDRPSPAVLASLARVDVARGQLAEAEAAASRAVEGAPADPRARTALALVLLHQADREEEGARVYFDAVAVADSAALDPLLKDIEVYLGQAKLDSLRAGGPVAAREALRRFWTERAALAGGSVPERLAVHYDRLDLARTYFRRRSRIAVLGRPLDPRVLRPRLPGPDDEFDDRGAVFVRYGAPDVIVATDTISSPPCSFASASRNTSTPLCLRNGGSWYYRMEDRLAGFHFLPDFAGDYYQRFSLPCPGTRDRYNLATTNELIARARVDPAAALLLGMCGRSDSDAAVQQQHVIAENQRTDERRERGLPPFRTDLPFWFDLASLSGGSATHLVAIIGVPALKLTADTSGGQARYQVHLRLTVVDTVAGTSRTVEATRVVNTAAPAPGIAVLRFPLDLDAPPSPHAVFRLRVDEPGTGVGKVYGGPFPLPDYAAPRLALSDLLLTAAGGAPNWHRGDAALELVPSAEFPGGDFSTYYEIYHLAAGTPYTTEIEVNPAEKGILGNLQDWIRSGRAVRLTFSGQATGHGTVPELRRIQSGLPPGRYRMRIRITAGNQSATADREFVVKSPGPG